MQWKEAIAEMNSKCAFPIIAIAFLVRVLPARAQSNQPVASAIPARSYQLLSEDEDWSFLNNPALRQDFWDPIKYIPLRNGNLVAGDAVEESIGSKAQTPRFAELGLSI
jgi:hypothetical protein